MNFKIIYIAANHNQLQILFYSNTIILWIVISVNCFAIYLSHKSDEFWCTDVLLGTALNDTKRQLLHIVNMWLMFIDALFVSVVMVLFEIAHEKFKIPQHRFWWCISRSLGSLGLTNYHSGTFPICVKLSCPHYPRQADHNKYCVVFAMGLCMHRYMRSLLNWTPDEPIILFFQFGSHFIPFVPSLL